MKFTSVYKLSKKSYSFTLQKNQFTELKLEYPSNTIIPQIDNLRQISYSRASQNHLLKN